MILKDYITYYLYLYNNDEIDDYKGVINNDLIVLLLKLRFNNGEKQIIKKNNIQTKKVIYSHLLKYKSKY